MPSPTLPTAQQADTHVRDLVADYVMFPRAKVRDAMVLTDVPLKYEPNLLANLAMALRAYIQRFDQSQTLTVADTRKSGVKVGDLCAIVRDRIGIKPPKKEAAV